MSGRELMRMSDEVERWKSRALALNRAILKHREDIAGPGPAADFAQADQRLYEARETLMLERK